MHSVGINRMRRNVRSALPQHLEESGVSLASVINEQGRLLPDIKQSHNTGAESSPDDLSRNVYGILGIPVDAVDVLGVLNRIEGAAASGDTFLISTPNLNFLVSSQTDAAFRESLLMSDLCPVDGVPIVWIARLLGVPINRRVAGSDIFDALKSRNKSSRPSTLLG